MTQITLIAGRGNPDSGSVVKVFPKSCTGCTAMACCDGFEPHYLSRHGDSEVTPYLGDDRGRTLDRERLTYRAGHFVKLSAKADMKRVVRRALKPQPFRALPKVSVVITNYNYGHYIGECIDSVLAQSYDNVEIIIVDDKSTDNSLAIMESYRSRWNHIGIMSSMEHRGQPAPCRNDGIEIAEGELIICLDADDKIAPTYIEEAVRKFHQHPEASIVYPATQCFGDSDAQWPAAPWDYGRELMGNYIVCASMFRKSMWQETGGYRTNLRGMEDYDHWVHAAGLGHVGVPLPRALFHYRVHKQGIFQTDVMPNHETKYAQLILNNWTLYPPSMVKAARKAKHGERIERVIE